MIKVDQSKCIGCGLCAALCPEHFQLNGDVFKAEVIKEGLSACVDEAIDNCPVQAISRDRN